MLEVKNLEIDESQKVFVKEYELKPPIVVHAKTYKVKRLSIKEEEEDGHKVYECKLILGADDGDEITTTAEFYGYDLFRVTQLLATIVKNTYLNDAPSILSAENIGKLKEYWYCISIILSYSLGMRILIGFIDYGILYNKVLLIEPPIKESHYEDIVYTIIVTTSTSSMDNVINTIQSLFLDAFNNIRLKGGILIVYEYYTVPVTPGYWYSAVGASNGNRMFRQPRYKLSDFPESYTRKIRLLIRRKDLFHRFLLLGPPGTGKTSLAEAMIAEMGYNRYMYIEPYAYLSKWLGESEKNLANLLREAEKNNIPIVFDNAEYIGSREVAATMGGASLAHAGIVSEILNFLERTKVPVFIIGNFIETLDPALYRPGRMDAIIIVNPPGENERYQLVKSIASRLNIEIPNGIALEIARKCRGCTIADLLNSVKLYAVTGEIHVPSRSYDANPRFIYNLPHIVITVPDTRQTRQLNTMQLTLTSL